MVFVTGFARGGTSWLRDCIAAHPEIAALPGERVVFRDLPTPEAIRDYFAAETAALDPSRFIVNKAPANAPYLGEAARRFPEAKFIFILRDPRDVLVSHQRGRQGWMRGANSTAEGCMAKLATYYQGWREADGLPNVLLVRYEDLHQDFFATMARVLAFIGVEHGAATLQAIFAATSFTAQTCRAHVEDRTAAKRKGVIGDWSVQLDAHDIDWFRRSPFFAELGVRHGYHWTTNTYRNIVQAMLEAEVNFLAEDDLLARRLDPGRANIVLQHDIDSLKAPWRAASVQRTAEIEAEAGVPAGYNFLPLDDPRYGPDGQAAALLLIEAVRGISRNSYVGLHVNACERFFPHDAPDAGDAPPQLDEILGYLQQQVADYRAAGIRFRTATAHGYGRGKKRPNNRDTPAVARQLATHEIALFDTGIRRELMDAASHCCAITDVGGMLKPRRLDHGYELTDPRAYASLPPGSFLRFLTHPGNYAVDQPATLVARVFN